MTIKGKLWSKTVEKLKDLNFEARDKIIMVKTLDDSILTKAEVIRVKNIVCLEDVSSGESEIPVKKIDKDEWKKLR